MSAFDLVTLRLVSRQGSWCWNQQTVDTVTAYLFTRGWRPPKSYGNARFIRARESNARHVDNPPNTIEISEARLKEPLTGIFKGVDKALRSTLKAETRSNILKDKVAEAQKALAKHDVGRVQDILNEIQLIVGG